MIVLILALTEASRSIFLCYFLDRYSLSTGPRRMKLMVGRGSGACWISTTALSDVGAKVAPRDGSLRNLLRCPARISLSIKNLRL